MPHLVYLTAGAAGMFCGSCMHDNALAKAILSQGWDVTLVPTYTPIRTDEDNHSVDQVFFGGINVYLQQKIPLFRHLPGMLDRWLDQPWLIRRLTAKASDTSPKLLGELAVSMLKGRHGFQRKEVSRLLAWLKREIKPDAIVLTNLLIGGCTEDLQQELGVPVIATLQGDDIFLESLPEPFKSQAIQLAAAVAKRCDGLLSHSQFYADFMSRYLDIRTDKMHITPLCIETTQWQSLQRPAKTEQAGMVIGYLARIAPEKGVQHLIDAFIELRQRPGTEQVRLKVAGWLGDHRKAWFDQHWQKIKDAGLAQDAEFLGTIERSEKVNFMASIDLLCVPTEYAEPKGLFALEAMAAGVPVVVPAHGAFPEMIQATGGGRLCQPFNSARISTTDDHLPELVEVLHQMSRDPEQCRKMGQAARKAVLSERNSVTMARQTIDVLQGLMSPRAREPAQRTVRK